MVPTGSSLLNISILLIDIQMDVTAMDKAINRIGVDRELMPFGRIKKETLVKALEVLTKIS